MSNPSCLDGPACRYVNSVVAVASQYWPDVCLSSCSAPVRSHHQLGSPATEEESVAQRSGKRADLKMDTLIFLTVVTAATSQAFVMFNYNRGRKYLAVCQQSLQTNISALNQWILIPSLKRNFIELLDRYMFTNQEYQENHSAPMLRLF